MSFLSRYTHWRAARGALLVAAAAGPGGGCATPAESVRGTAGAYALLAVAGDSLPAVMLDNGIVLRTIEADTIRLDRDGSGFRHALIRTRPVRPGGEAVLEEVRERFHYRVEDRRITIDFGCPGFLSLALCAAPPHGIGELTNDRLLLTYLMGTRGDLEYRRISDRRGEGP